MVAQFQEEYMESRYAGTRAGYSVPNFRDLAISYGFNNSFSIRTMGDFREISTKLSSLLNEPTLVEVHLSPSAKALPKMKHSE
jgi:thiamine pyrophosphate-dependent acetolactate synthase large subunit-like protein